MIAVPAGSSDRGATMPTMPRTEASQSRSLRIAHVTATFPPYQGGTGNVCFYNARELARRGHDVHVFTATEPGAPRDERLAGVAVHRLQPLVRVGNAPILPNLFGVLRGFDIIHLHYPFIVGAEVVKAASLAYHTPMIVSFHNDLIGNGTRARVFSAYQRLSAQISVCGAARLCAVSLDHYQSSTLRCALPRHSPLAVELPNGVDVERFRPAASDVAGLIRARHGIPAGAPLVLFVAALDRAHHFKGLNTLLQALAILPPETWLLIVGDGDLRADYQEQAAQLGLSQRTVFVGGVPHESTPPYFRSADVTVLPSSPPESFGLILIESLACGTPVIASNIPGVRTVVTHNQDGYLTSPWDVPGLARDLQRLLSLPSAVRRDMGRAGRRKVEERYSWPAIGEKLESIYMNVTGRIG